MSGNQNIERDVLEVTEDVVDSVGLQEMEDRFRGLALEEQYVMPDVRHWIVSINPYPRVIACALKFNTNSSLVSTVDNIEAHESILQVNSNTIRTSMVFVWSANNGVNIVTKAKFQNSTLGAGYGVQVFPVMTRGMDDMPIHNRKEYIEQLIRQNYEMGNYLIYATHTSADHLKPKEFVGIPDDGSGIPDEDIGKFIMYKCEQARETQEGVLLYVSFCLNNKREEEFHGSHPIEKIISTRNPVLPLVGIYAGGPMPTDVRRLSYNQPLVSEDNQIAGNFRFEIDYQRGSEREGFFCSNGSVCNVYETRKGTKGFNLLLTEHTFAIVDGGNLYNKYVKDRSRTAIHPYHANTHMSNPMNFMPLMPKIVILFESVNGLVITDRDFTPNLRTSILRAVHMDRQPIVLEWYALQRDLELSRPHTESVFQQIMHSNDIYDCGRYDYDRYSYLISLCTYINQHGNNFFDNWNIYLLIDGNPQNGFYYLLGRLNLKYMIRPNGVCTLNSWNHFDSPFGVDITDLSFKHRKQFVTPALQQYRKLKPLFDFIRRLGSTHFAQIENRSVISNERNAFLRNMNLVIQ